MSGRGFRWLYGALLVVPILLVFGVRILRQDAAAPQGGSDPSVVGQWSTLVNVGLEAIHSHLLPTGKVLMFGYHADEHNHDSPHIWDPVTGSMTSVPTNRNIFCSGHSFLPDGRLLIAGGHISDGVGIADTVLFDPFALTWTRGPDMNAGRWYPTNTTLPNGDVLIVQGTSIDARTPDDLPQIYNPETNTLRDLSSARIAQWKWYPLMFVAPNGRVFDAGPLAITRSLDTSGTGSWTTVGNTASGTFRESGTGVMYDVGKVLILAGSDPPTPSAEVIDLNQASPAWRIVSPMAFSRRHANSTLLPDGKVLVTGGSCGIGADNQNCPVLPAEMWDPGTERFTTMASAAVYRGYHSTALLLPDARVLVSGGDQSPRANQIYSPPYLFKGARPTINSAPATVRYGETFFVGTPDPSRIAAVHWIRLGSVTHSFDENQRISRLTFSTASNGLNVLAPSNRNLTPPGHYMVFLLDSNGVPSVSAIMRIDRPISEDNTAPAIWNVAASPTGPTSVNISWSTGEPATSQVEYGLTVGYGSSTNLDSTLRTSHKQALSNLAPSTMYHYRVKSTDAAGHSTVSPDFTFTMGSAPDNLVWTALVNVTANGSSLSKSGGCDGCGDAGAVSNQSIASGDGYVEFTASEANTYRGAGLSNGNTNTLLSDIDFAILLTATGRAEIRENGVWKFDTAYVANTVFRVGVVGGRVQYRKNGSVLYTSATLPAYPLLVDTTLWSSNATITNAVVSNANGPGPGDSTPPIISSVAASGITASSATINWTTNEAADSQVDYGVTVAYGSSTNLDGNRVTAHSQMLSGLTPATLYHYRVRSRDAAGNIAVSGDFTFTSTPNSGGGGGAQNVVWTALVNLTATGNSLRKTGGCEGCGDAGAVSTQSIASGDGYVEFTASEATLYRGAGLSNGNTNTLLSDIDFAILLTAGGRAEVREKGAWKSDTAYSAGTVLRVAVFGGKVQYSKNGLVFYTSVAAPVYPLLVDTTFWSLNSTVTNAVISNAGGGPGPGDTTPPVISSVAASGITSSSATITWTTNEPSDSQVDYGPTAAYGSSTILDAAQVTAHSQTLSGLTPSALYHYRVKSKDAAGNAAVSGDFTFTTSAPGVGPQNVVWTTLVNVTATGNSLRKSGGCEGCGDAGAVSTQTIGSGDGYVEFTASEATTYRGAGLSNGNTNNLLSDIDFAILLTPGWAAVREKGVWKSDTPYTAGTVFRVAVVGGQVKYFKNGVLFYTSAAPPVYPLIVDTTFWSLNSTLTNAVISGAQ